MTAPASMQRPILPESTLSFWLSAVAGYVDTAGFILLAGLFTAHVTGNLVLAGATLAGGTRAGVWPKLMLLPVFAVAVIGASLLGQWAGRRGYRPLAVLLVAESLALGVFQLAGLWIAQDGQRYSDLQLFALATPAVVAMGMQNALMRGELKAYLPTTMMTGNTTQFTLDVFALLRGETGAEIRPRLCRTALVLAGFLCGATLGAWAAAVLRLWAPTLPALAVALLALCALRSSSPPPVRPA